MNEEEFNIFLPIDSDSFIEKSYDGEKGNYIRGWASTPSRDRDGDIILPDSLDIHNFLERGYINYEHKRGDAYKLGIPTKNTYIDPKKGLFVEAKLFMDNPYAKEMWNLSRNLAKSGSGRKVGFSIEGKMMGRDYKNPSIIKSVKVNNVSLTTNPANTEATWETFTKSFVTGDDMPAEDVDNPGDVDMEGAAALRRQSIAHSISNLCYNIKEVTDDDWKLIAKSMDEEGRFGDDVLKLFLQVSKGVSAEGAQEIIHKLS